MSDKKISPREAAIQVLKKAEELYKASSLAKGDWKKIHDKLEREGYSKESADKIDGAIKAKVNLKKDEDMGDVPPMDDGMAMSEEKSQEKSMKGHIKLAKFIGAMEHKRGQKKPMDKMDGSMPAAPAPAMPQSDMMSKGSK